ncbi:MAG: ribonuclease E inhibitor RraB [Gammaproteobacteria bacterium]|nr:ribonuclease E inhibitor RraB [Gammaproteobacteria bacterium]
MNETYPNDADGDALRRIAADGSDMTKPMEVDYHVAAPDQSASQMLPSDSSNDIGSAAVIDPGTEDRR